MLVPARAVSLDLGSLGGQGGSAVAKSSEFRVRLPGRDDWLAADLVTRDGELGLAWLRLREPGKSGGVSKIQPAVHSSAGTIRQLNTLDIRLARQRPADLPDQAAGSK